MVQLVSSEPRVRRVAVAGDEAAAVMSRLQSCGDVPEQGNDTIKAACVDWREEQRIGHSTQDGIAELGLGHCMSI